MKRIQSKDKVIVTTGKSKGHIGLVRSVKGDKVFVEGANLIKKHVKPNPQLDQKGALFSKKHLFMFRMLHCTTLQHLRQIELGSGLKKKMEKL